MTAPRAGDDALVVNQDVAFDHGLVTGEDEPVHRPRTEVLIDGASFPGTHPGLAQIEGEEGNTSHPSPAISRRASIAYGTGVEAVVQVRVVRGLFQKRPVTRGRLASPTKV